MDPTAAPKNQETQLLREIGGLSDRVRGLRAQSAFEHGAQIKAIEQEMRAKWAELRTLRATPSGIPPEIAGTGSRG